MSFRFTVEHCDGNARACRMEMAHGTVETPVFMPVGTQATVKGLTPDQLREAGATMILGNTYHLALRPGDDLIAELGGLHQFMGWYGPILTDSGGFQVYSLALNCRINDQMAIFRSHIDGADLELSPEKAVSIQENLGSDIAMCLDECPSSDSSPDKIHDAVRRTILWAERSRACHRRCDQALFAILQGGMDLELRASCAKALASMDFPGYALGGFSVGETANQMLAVLPAVATFLPADRPRYLMGVGRPEDILEAVGAGLDMFDCVLPTRNGRNASAFTDTGAIRVRNACHKRDPSPIESDCQCYTCRHFCRGYLHHLFQANEMLGPILLSFHNVAYYCRLMKDIRQAIQERRFAQFQAVRLARWRTSL
jgi:queuine tRNA-ribosyltransferase